MKAKVPLYLVLSLLLALTPVWAREVIAFLVAGSPSGSDGDVFGWLGLVVWGLAANILFHSAVLLIGRFTPLAMRALVTVASALLFVAAMAWVHRVRVP